MTTLAEIQAGLNQVTVNLNALTTAVAAIPRAVPVGSVLVDQAVLDAVGTQVTSVNTQVTNLTASIPPAV